MVLASVRVQLCMAADQSLQGTPGGVAVTLGFIPVILSFPFALETSQGQPAL